MDEKIAFRQVAMAEIAEIWGAVAIFLRDALQHGGGDFTLADVLARLLTERQQLWVAEDKDSIVGAVVTEIAVYPRAKILSVPLLGGTIIDKWKHFDKALAEWGMTQGCTQLEGYARQGWARKAPEGWYPVYTVIRRDIVGIGSDAPSDAWNAIPTTSMLPAGG